ncbi:MAG: ATP-binding protein [Elusimicrobiota bacterium]
MDLIGQNIVIQYLSEGLKANRLSPSLLFVGAKGTGKKNAALLLAACYSCLKRDEISIQKKTLPYCGECVGCQKVLSNSHPDLLLVNMNYQAFVLKEKPETQTAIKIDSIRESDRFAYFKPIESKRRCVIIEDAHKMTTEAANALLKILEEPPNNAQFILLAADEHSLPSTVLSRCAILRFKPLSIELLSKHLAEKLKIPFEKAQEIAELSTGSLEKAQEIYLKGEEEFQDLNEFSLEELFEMLSEPKWKKDARKRSQETLTHLIEQSRKNLYKGDLTQVSKMKKILKTSYQISRNVSPKLALENLFIQLKKEKL